MAEDDRKVLSDKENTIDNEDEEGPPKPPRTAFMCFSDANAKELQAGTKEDTIRRVAQAWRSLSDVERAHWDEEARNDKLRYVREKASYQGPWNLPKRRAKKHPLAPRRPMSAFLKYSQTRRALVKQQNPDMSNTDVSRLLGEMWRTASSKEKAPYVEQEQLERQAYKDEMMRWKAQQARLDAASRTSHQEMEESRTDMGSRQSSTTVRMPPVVAPTYYGNYPQYHRYPPQYDVRQQYPMAYQTQQSFAEAPSFDSFVESMHEYGQRYPGDNENGHPSY